jgi:hypothetical protein
VLWDRNVLSSEGNSLIVPEGNWGAAADTGKQFVRLRLFRTKGGYPSEGIYFRT